MRTPGILIFGLVMAPCGWILDLTSTVAPSWRQLYSIAGQSSDTVLNQGIWDICKSFQTSQTVQCNLQSTDQTYFKNSVIPVAQGMMIASLIVTLIGLAVLTPATRCWTNKHPRWMLAGIGGVLIFCSGVLAIIPIAWYTHIFTSLNTTTVFVNPQSPDIRVGYCIVLGFIGGIMEVLGGFVIFLGMFRCCGGQIRGEKPQPVRVTRTSTAAPNPVAPRRTNPPRNATPSSVTGSSSSMYSLGDDLDYPRAKAPKRGADNSAFRGTPYDADL